MKRSPEADAILLLTARLGKSLQESEEPLTPKEWSRLASWMKENEFAAECILDRDFPNLVKEWKDKRITSYRIEHLLKRKVKLGLKIENWERAGIWVSTISDSDYPGKLKQRLGDNAPPVLFGCGDKSLLNQKSIAVVGSRNTDANKEKYSRKIVNALVEQDYCVVSGGAKGIDQCAMMAAIKNDGNAVGVLANNLLRSTTLSDFRKSITSGNLALISHVNPESGFSVGNAMARNKYIYCLSEAAIVVESGDGDHGGTWNGAIENLQASWKIPVLAKMDGNAKLAENEGAYWLTGEIVENLENFIESLPSEVEEQETMQVATTLDSSESMYEVFLRKLAELTTNTCLNADEIAKQLDLSRTQVHTWLKCGKLEGRVIKKYKPVRYFVSEDGQKQKSLKGI